MAVLAHGDLRALHRHAIHRHHLAAVRRPDLLVEVAEWTTVEARVKHLEQAKATGAFATVFELLAGRARATVLRDLPSTTAN